MKEMKIRSTSHEHSRKVQEALFAEGYSWNGRHKVVQYDNAKFLFAGTFGDNEITYESDDVEYFDKHNATEYVLTPQGKFVTVAQYYKQPETPKVNIPERYENPQTDEDKAVKDSFDKAMGTLYEPIGLLPKHIHDKQRMYEILDAMRRYVEADKKIPMMWIVELDELGGEFIEEEF